MLRIFVSLLALSLVGLAPEGAGAAEVKLDYVGYIGIAQVLRLEVGLELQSGRSGRYRVAVDAVTLGAIGKLFPFQVTAGADGRTMKAGLRPERYQSRASLWQRRQAITLAYGPDGRVTVTSEPPSRQSRQAAARGLGDRALDPASAALAIMVRAAASGSCGGSVSVFDGFRRFDLLLDPAGFDVIERSATSYYEGPATACNVRVKLGEGVAEAEANSGIVPESAQLWLAAVRDGLPAVPVRLTGASVLGELRLDLVGVRPQAPGSP